MLSIFSVIAVVIVAALGALAALGVFGSGAGREEAFAPDEASNGRRSEFLLRCLLLLLMIAFVAGSILILEFLFCVGGNGESMC